MYPAFDTQAVTAVDAVTPAVPELPGQAEHGAEPVVALNESAAHTVKGPPSEPECPAFATHAVTAEEPVAAPVAELDAPQLEMMIDSEREEEERKMGRRTGRQGKTEKGGMYRSWVGTQRRAKKESGGSSSSSSSSSSSGV